MSRLSLTSSILLIGVVGSLLSVGCDRTSERDSEEHTAPVDDSQQLDDLDSEHYAITGATVIDGTGDSVLEDAVVVIEDGLFSSVGTADTTEIADGIDTVELDGFYIYPGLIDSHIHAGALVVGHHRDRGGDGDTAPDNPTARIVELASEFTQYGITTVHSTGDPFPWILEAREAIADAGVDMPDVHVSGPLLTAPGGHPVATIYADNPWLREHASVLLENPEAARNFVRRLASSGVDVVKVVVDDGDGRLERLDDDLLEAIADEAGDHDLAVTAHIGDGDDARRVVDAGVDGIEHARDLDDDVLQAMAASDIYYVPTLSVYDAAGDVPDESAQSVARAAELGVDIVAGSDVGNPGLQPGASLHRELQLLVDAGLPPHQAITAATALGADILGQAGHTGAITPGARADFAVVSSNPIDDIENTEDIRWVLRDGRVVVDNS